MLLKLFKNNVIIIFIFYHCKIPKIRLIVTQENNKYEEC